MEEIYGKDLYKKHNGREEYNGFYAISKKIYQDGGEVLNNGFAVDKENLLVLKARIDALLIDETKPATTIDKVERNLP
jgi:hypothetical protein